MAVKKPAIVEKYLNTNYTQGRNGTPVRKITFHHAVGPLSSIYPTFSNPSRQSSSHFGVGATEIQQYVRLEDTAWTNGNWNSNLESITIEHEGDWRNGFWSEEVINNSAKLVAWLRTVFPGVTFNRHREVSSGYTLCPADLPVEEIWNRASAIMKDQEAPANPTPQVNLQLTDIVNRKMVLNKDANLWDLTFTTWQTAKSVKTLAKGTQIEVSATARHPLGGLYYLTEYSFSKGVMNGFNSVDCDEIPTPPVPPTPPTPPTPPVPPTPDPYPNWFIQFWVKLWEAIKNILGIK